MKVRPYEETDREELERIRMTCPPGAFFADPSKAPNSPAFVVEDSDGWILGALVYRMTAEPFLYVDQTLAPSVKWSATVALAETSGPQLLARGIEEVHLFPNDRAFAWRLARKFKAAYGDLRHHIVWNISQAFGGQT